MKIPVYTCDLCGYRTGEVQVRREDGLYPRFMHGLAVDGQHKITYVTEPAKGEKHVCSACYSYVKTNGFEG